MSRTYKPRPDFADGIPRTSQGVFVRMTPRQFNFWQHMADERGLTLQVLLAYMLEAMLEVVIPSERPSSHQNA